MYRTYLFGSPSIITCFPTVNKFVFQSEDFFLDWPSVELMGHTSLVAVQGRSHERLKSYVTGAINRPDALRRIAQLVQPRMVAALESWAQKGRITALDEAKKVMIPIYIFRSYKELGFRPIQISRSLRRVKLHNCR